MVLTLHLLLHLCFYNERFVEHTQQVSKFYIGKLNFLTFSPGSPLSQGKLLPCALTIFQRPHLSPGCHQLSHQLGMLYYKPMLWYTEKSALEKFSSPKNQYQTSFSSHDTRSGKSRKLQNTPSRMFAQTGHNAKVLKEVLFGWYSAKFLFILGTQDLLYSEKS